MLAASLKARQRMGIGCHQEEAEKPAYRPAEGCAPAPEVLDAHVPYGVGFGAGKFLATEVLRAASVSLNDSLPVCTRQIGTLERALRAVEEDY